MHRIRLLGIDLEDNNSALYDGSIATCRLSVARDVGYGSHELRLTSVGLSDNIGTTLVPDAQAGAITVTECSGTLPFGCTNETVDPKDTLKIRGGKRIDWRWRTSQPIELTDPSDQQYRFCIYDSDPSGIRLVGAVDVPSGSAWTLAGSSTWRYEDRTRGIRRVELRRTGSGATRLRVQGESPVWIPPLPLTQAPAIAVELATNRTCSIALYSAPARLNAARGFYDAND